MGGAGGVGGAGCGDRADVGPGFIARVDRSLSLIGGCPITSRRLQACARRALCYFVLLTRGPDVVSFADWIVHRHPAPLVSRHGPLAPSRQRLFRITSLGLGPTAPGGCVIHLLINARRPTAVTRILRLSAVAHEAAYLGLLDEGQRGGGGNGRRDWCQPDGRIWQVSRCFCCFCWCGCSKWQ